MLRGYDSGRGGALGRLGVFAVLLTLTVPGLSAQTVELASRVHPSQFSDTGASDARDGTPPPLSLSADGRYLAFASKAANLVPGQQDANDSQDVFLRDLVNETTVLVSHSLSAPGKAGNGRSADPVISGDGRYVAFFTTATDIAPGQPARSEARISRDLLLFDRVTGTASVVFSRPQAFAAEPVLSADGRYLAFTSDGNLAPGQRGGHGDNVLLYDRVARTFRLVSHTSLSATSRDGDSSAPALSADGRYVAFQSTSLTGPVTVSNVLLYDRDSEAVTLLGPGSRPAVSADGRTIAFLGGGFLQLYDRVTRERTQVSGANAGPDFVLSADGQFAVLRSDDDHVVPGQEGDTQGGLFLYDRRAKTFTPVSRRRGATMVSTAVGSYGVSRDGRFVVFASGDTRMVPNQVDGNAAPDVFLFDRSSGKLALVSHSSDSFTATGKSGSSDPVISANGARVAFVSLADDLEEDLLDFNRGQDVFAHEVSSGTNAAVTRRAPEMPSLSPDALSTARALSADGLWVAFESTSSNVVQGEEDANPLADVFLYDRATRTSLLVNRSNGSAARTSNESARNPVLSAGGRYVLFGSRATDIVPGLSSREDRVFLFDRMAGTTRLVGPSERADWQISLDGRWAAFTTAATNVIPGQQSSSAFPRENVFLWSRETGRTVLVSHSIQGTAVGGNNASSRPQISAGGRYAAFTSLATNLAPEQAENDPPGPTTPDLLLFDRDTGGTALVGRAWDVGPTPFSMDADGRFIAFSSLGADGEEVRLFDRTLGTSQVIASQATTPKISAGGRYVAYLSTQPPNHGQIYLYDRVLNMSTLVTRSASLEGGPSNGFARAPVISTDGRYIAFLSSAEDLVPGQVSAPGREQPNHEDVFLFDRTSGTTVLVNRRGGSPVIAAGHAEPPFLSASGRQVAFTSALDLVEGDFNLAPDAYVFSLDPPPPAPLSPCTLFDTRRRTDRPALTSNLQRTVAVRGACGVPATAKQVVVKVTVSNPSGKGNLRFYPGAVTATPSGILRFERGATRTETFTLPLSTNGTLTILPFVASRGTVHGAVEVNGYFD